MASLSSLILPSPPAATLVNNVANLSEGQGSLQSQMETCSSLLQQVNIVYHSPVLLSLSLSLRSRAQLVVILSLYRTTSRSFKRG